MSPSANIVPVPYEMLPRVWPALAPWIEQGLTAASTSSLEGIQRRLRDRDVLWGVFVEDGLCGAFVSGVREIDDEDKLVIYALGAKGLPRFAAAIDETMQAEARRLGLERIRFAGRPGWARVLPDLAIVGAADDHIIYERAAS